MILTPALSLIGDPGTWDEFTLVAATIHLEADGEPWPGPLAVGWVIRHRMEAWHSSVKRVILGPEGQAYDDGRPYEAFSAWNDDYRGIAEARLAGATAAARERAWRAASGALWDHEPDPVVGALFYLNPILTRKIRPDGRLPTWAADPTDARLVNPRKLVVMIGQHAFLSA